MQTRNDKSWNLSNGEIYLILILVYISEELEDLSEITLMT